jgi:hypothetical protein
VALHASYFGVSFDKRWGFGYDIKEASDIAVASNRRVVWMKGLWIGIMGGWVLVAWAGSVAATPRSWDDVMRGGGVVWDQQPLPSGGPGADTDFYSDSGQQVWQQVADDILLADPATIRRIVWWGFYGGNFTGSPLPPEGPETMRIRFYDARPEDGLPGATLYEESFLNPSRTATGRIVATPLYPSEYIFQVDLPTPFDLDAGEVYWLEVVQVGDVDSHYRWEYSPGNGTPYAFLNPWVPDWQRTGTTANVAFQLSTVPEPATFVLFAFGFVLAGGRSRRRGGFSMRN